MSISFNGLASGLDTSSWITSLTALKQAKVTTLQQQREELVVSKNTLSSIRSFFTSFRSTLEKITDSRFNIVSMNLFAQNLATSANLNVLSATATSEAEEGKYEVKVDKVATNTQAVSKHKYTALVDKTKLADKKSTLVSIGANEGSFTINLDGDIKTVNITSDTTIGSLISTLKGYGIDAEFNEKTGIFSADIDADDITENGTNIKNALHLVSQNKGYFSTDLTYNKVDENAFSVANENTLIWDIQGMNPAAKEMVDDRDDINDENNRTLTLTAGGESFYVYLDDDETIGSLVNDINNDAEMQAKGVVASFENGVFKLVNAVISGVGQTGFDEAFGMDDNISTNIVQKSENLSYEAPVHIYKSASLDSKLVDLNTGIKLNDGDTIEVMDANGESTTITMSDDMTIGDLFAEMEAAGLEITLNENDTVDLTSGVVTGGTYDVLNALGLRDGGVLREKTIQVVGSTINEDTTLGAMGISGTLTIYNEDDSVLETITIDANSEMTMGEFLAELESKGITSATLTDGVITLNSDENRYVAGDLATALGIDVIGTTNESSTLAVTYTQKLTATEETKLVDVDALESTFNGNPDAIARIFVHDSNDTKVATIDILGGDSLESLVEKLNTAGFEAELELGRISLTSTNGNFLSGAVASALGLNAVRTTVANSITSDTPVIYEKTYDVTSTIGISQTSTRQITQHTNTDSLTALSAVTSSSMVSGRTYKISTAADLEKLATFVNGGTNCSGVTFVMSNDIDLSSVANWTAIGNSSKRFSGTFDGNGYEITGVSIDSTSGYQGLFGFTDGATIKNLGFTGVNVTATGLNVGALVGYAKNSTIENVYTEGTVSGSNNVGGLVGYANNSTITSCQASGTVVGSNSYVGGLVGYISGTITSSSSSANVSGKASVGGIAGFADGATLISVYSTGTLDDTDNSNVYYTGGLVGYSLNGLTIQDSWTKARVESGGGSVVGCVLSGTALISNTKATSSNYYASITVTATGTTSGCSVSSSFINPFTINPRKLVSDNFSVSFISLNKVGLNGTYSITVSNEGTLTTLTISSTDSLSRFEQQLESAGLSVEFSSSIVSNNGPISMTQYILNGVTISGTEDVYIVGNLDSRLEKAFNLEDKGTAITTTKASTTTINATLTEDTTFAELGFDNSGNKISYTLYSANGSEIATYSHNSHLKVEEFLSVLNSNGFTAEIVDGRLSIESNGGNYIKSYSLDEFNITEPAYTVYSANAENDYKTFGTTATSTVAIVASAMTTVGVSQTSSSKIELYTDTTNLTALSAVTASDMVSGSTFKISSTADLEALATIVNGGTNCSGVTFVMSNDIDLSSIANWTAIGNNSTSFKGTFDGNGHEITGLSIDSTSSYQGLFGFTYSATIKNLGLTGVDITSTGSNVGALVGYAYYYSTIQNVYTEGTVSGSGYVGGLVGYVSDSTLTSCQASGTVVGSSNNVGGLVGNISYGTITSSSSSANVSGKASVGGIAGYADRATLISVYSTGTLDDTDNTDVYRTGGLVGFSSVGLTIQDSWTKASVESGGGSVVGYVSGTALISNTKATSSNYYATIGSSATGTTSGCSASSSFSNPFTVTTTAYATSATKMSEIGLTDTRYITVIQNGTESTIAVSTTTTIDTLCSSLKSKGIYAKIENGYMTISGDGNSYIKGELDDKLDNIFNLADLARTYTVIPNNTTTKGVTYTSGSKIEQYTDTTNLTALSAVTSSSMVSGRTYKISTTADLEKLATFVKTNAKTCSGVTFVLANDIDLSSIANWTAIGNNSTKFSGTFDGNGYEISGLSIDSTAFNQGLFGYTDGATIKNLGLTGVDITTSITNYAGALVGQANNSTIQNVYTEGTVSGTGYVGGLVGSANNSTLTSCQASGTVVGSDTVVGGLVGYISSGTITSSSSSANVSGIGFVGGIAGFTNSATLISVYSTGTLDDTDNTDVYFTGGLVGGSSSLTIRDSWTKATVESGGGSVVGHVQSGTALISNTKALSDNYYAGIFSSATGTTSGCSASSSFSNPFTVTTTAYATSAFKMSQIGLSETKYITVIQNGTESTIAVKATTTISGLCSSLQGKGFTASFTDGKISIAGAENVYIKGRLDDELRDVLNLNDPSSIYTYVQKTNTNQGVTFTSTAELEKTTSTYNLTALSAVTAPEVVSGATFKISSTEDMLALTTLVNNGNTCAGVTFVMENDIDLSSIANWTAIGSTSTKFSGTFDGNGYEISGLSIDSTSTYQGLFGYTDGATIKNLGLTGVNVTSTTGYVGALVGYAYNSTIQNVYTEGSVNGGAAYVGGLVGYVSGSTLTSCQASGTVVGSSNYVGGLMGYFSGTITSSSSSANVSGKALVGGIAGYAGGATLISVYSTGTLDDTDNTDVYRTGGLVGYSSNGLIIQDSWTKASVESGGGSVVGYVSGGTALISNTKALSDNYYAGIGSSAIGTINGCSASSSFSNPFTIEVNTDKYATIHTSLGQLGLTSTRYVTINNNGTTYKCTATSSTTLGDFINDLKSKGLDVEYEDYKLTIRQGNAYIVGELNDELDDIFNFDNVYTSNAIENVTEADATLDELIQAKYGSDWASWTGNSEIEIYNNGTTTTIDLSTIKGSTTTGQFFDILESAGLTCSISNGIVSISGGEDVYISSDRDKKLAELFGFSGNYTSVQVTSSYSGKFNSVDVAKTMAESTTLGELADRVITQNVAQEITNVSKDVSSLTALSAVTASDMVSGRTYKISTTADLEALATIVNGGKTCSGVTFVMSNDIDLSSIANWTAIGNSSTKFSGTFDGNGYEISGLRINSSSDCQGLFGYTNGATIKNLGLTGVAVISTGARVGALVGNADNSTIENVYTAGTVSGSGYVGGLVGSVSGSTITSCQASGTAAGKSSWVGGLLGVAYNATIAASSSDTNVSGQSQLGGIVGYTSNVKLISVYSTGTLNDTDNTGVYYTGGLVGRSANGLTIQDSWTKASVESGGGSVVGYVGGGTALISNTKALSDNYYASITVTAIGTTDNCSTITADETPFTVQAKKVHASTDTFAEVGLTENVTLTVVQNDTETTITVTPTTTCGTLLQALTNAGLNLDLYNNFIQGTDTAYVKGQVDPRLAEILGLEKQGASTITAINQVGQTVSATFTTEDTVGAISTWLRDNLGATVNIVDGKISISTDPNGPARILDASNDLDELLRLDGDLQDVTNSESAVHRIGTTIMETLTISEDTYLSDLGVTEGEFYLYSNGVKNVIQVTKDDTIGSLMQTLTNHGIDSEIVVSGENSYFKIFGDDDNYLEASTSPDNASNIMEILFPIKETEPSCYSNTLKVPETNASQEIATEDTLVSAFDKNGNTSAGVLEFNYDGNDYKITITSDDTFATLIEKFEEVGVSASIYDGRLVLNSTDKIFSIYGHSDSNLASNLGLNYTTVLENTTSSTSEVESKYQENEVIEASAAQYADADTKLSMLGISSGSLSIYRAGEKAQVNVDADGTFATLQSTIKAAFTDVDLRFTNGYLEIYSTTGGVTIEVGATTDTSNIVAITGLSNKGELSATSSRELYKVNGDSKLTEADIFKRGDVTEGTFIIGNAEFTIDDKTTLNNIIGQINSSAEANATAYWDAVDGKFVIKSRVSGATFVNIEAGTSNFTDILGFTITERDGDGNITSTKLNIDTQEVGGNAQFSINGTNYTSTSNIVGSDVTKIKGLTLDLKGTSNGETVTVTVEKDYNTAADAMQEVVDAYNALIENVDKEIAMDGDLNDESTLKLLRNQIRSLMMGSIGGSSPYRMLSSIGISTESASASNISTTTINKLEFNKDKFIEAFRADTKAVENLLVGNGAQQGILTKVENVVENAVKAVTGYFSTAENSYTQQINRLDSKIEKANAAVAAYKSRLEQKFQYMDMMIAKMQEQFSTFLGT